MAERQVVFYECQDIDNRPPFDRLKAVVDINDLDDEDWRVPDGDYDLGVIVDRPGSATATTRLRLLRIRPDAPYMLSAARKLTRVQVAANEHIAEFTSAVVWPDNFMAAISSRDAPGHKRLSLYFNVTSDQDTHIVNLFRPDVVQRLKVLREHGLRSVQAKVQTSHLAQIEADDRTKGWGQFWKAGKGTDAAMIGVEVTMGRSSPDATLNNAFGLSAEALAEHIDLLESMHVKGRDQHGEIEEINMKHERIGVAVDIEASASNDAVYRAIERARKTAEKDAGKLANAARGS
jgi:hypothetical protein